MTNHSEDKTNPNLLILPLEEAVALNAKENLERDRRLKLVDEKDNEETRNLYLEEARFILETYGESYGPDFPDHHLIRVESQENTAE